MMEFCARPGYVVGGQPGFLAIGASALALSPSLAALAGLTGAANKAPYFTAANAAALFDLSAFGRSLVDDADAPAARTTLGLGTAAVETIGTSGATVPRLNGANSYSAQQTFNAPIALSSTNPIVYLSDTDATAGERNWRLNLNGQFLEWQTGSDAFGSWDTAWFMQRTAGVVTSIQFNKSTQFNGPFTATSSLDISSANPVMNFFENDVGTDLKRSRFLTNGGVLAYQIGNDAASSYTSLVSFTRATNVSGTMTVHSVTTLSVAGTLQMSNNNAVKGRNAANSADIDIAKVNASNRVEVAGEEIISWTAWTPTITVQTGALESSTIVQARYRKSGKMVEGHLTVRLKNDGTGTGAGYVRLTTPATPAYASVAIGRGTYDGHALIVEINTAGYLQVTRTNSDSPIKAPGGSPNIDNYVVISFAYEVAS